jgi:hypothetical protein
VLVPIQPEPGPARGDHAVNRQQPFSQNGACNVQIFRPRSRQRDGHHMRAGLAKVWFDNGSAAVYAIAAIQPVTAPIFMMSTIARSDAPAATAFAIP